MFMNEHSKSNSLLSSPLPDKIRANTIQSFRSVGRHAPYFIYGGPGSGKSSLIAELYSKVTSWFDNAKVHRVIRFAAASPRSAYNLELLRVICQQISIIFNIPEGYLPKDASFDPLYINNWFQNLIRRCEDLQNEILFLFIDDLHKLNPLDCDIVAALSWLPISLPRNVYLICSTKVPIEGLRLTPIQKERFRNADCFHDLSLETNATTLITAAPNETFQDYILRIFDELEREFCRKGFGRFATYLTCSEYGLTETELLELLMPIHNSEALIDSSQGDFNFSTFRCLRNRMSKSHWCRFSFYSNKAKKCVVNDIFFHYLIIAEPIIREKLMSGRILIQWRHSLCAEIAKVRYMDPDKTRAVHTEIANIFFNQEQDDSDEISSEHNSDEKSGGKIIFFCLYIFKTREASSLFPRLICQRQKTLSGTGMSPFVIGTGGDPRETLHYFNIHKHLVLFTVIIVKEWRRLQKFVITTKAVTSGVWQMDGRPDAMET